MVSWDVADSGVLDLLLRRVVDFAGVVAAPSVVVETASEGVVAFSVLGITRFRNSIGMVRSV